MKLPRYEIADLPRTALLAKPQKVEPKTEVVVHNLPRPEGLRECAVVLDVGCGIRPMNWYRPTKAHVCVDAYLPYCEILEAAGRFEVHCLMAAAALQPDFFGEVGAVYLLDVIEHMEKDDALRILEMAQEVAQEQVVIYTPYGFMEQTVDAWGLGAHDLQTHRSGWLPDEFTARGWRTQLYKPRRIQVYTDGKPNPQGFYATWDSNSTAN